MKALEQHPFCDFAATLGDIKPGAPIAVVGIEKWPKYYCTEVVELFPPEADIHGHLWILESSGYRTSLEYSGVLPHSLRDEDERWSSEVTIVNSTENRRKMFDLLVTTDTFVYLQSAQFIAWQYPDEFGIDGELNELEAHISELNPNSRLVVRPI